MDGVSSSEASVEDGSSTTLLSTRLRCMPNLAYWASIGERRRAVARAAASERTIMSAV